MFMLIPTVKLFSSRVFMQYKANQSFCLCFLCPLYTNVRCCYLTYHTIFFFFFVLFFFSFVLATYGVLCISIACDITIQCLFLPLACYLSLAYVSHVRKFAYSITWARRADMSHILKHGFWASAHPFLNNYLTPLEGPLPVCVAAGSKVYFHACQFLWYDVWGVGDQWVVVC